MIRKLASTYVARPKGPQQDLKFEVNIKKQFTINQLDKVKFDQDATQRAATEWIMDKKKSLAQD